MEGLIGDRVQVNAQLNPVAACNSSTRIAASSRMESRAVKIRARENRFQSEQIRNICFKYLSGLCDSIVIDEEIMKLISEGILAVTLLALGAHTASAGVIAFDDAYASLGEGGKPATYYSSEGVTISGSYYGLVGGVGKGDPGNWSLEGTNGSAVLGCNEGSSCSPTFNFLSPVSEVSLDIGESEGFASFTVSGYLDDTLVNSETLDINDPNESTGTWDTFSLTGLMDEVVISSADVRAYGVDNVVIPSTPEPATWSIAAVGLGLMVAVWCRRKRTWAKV
jgi:hypothetical protein